MPASRRSSQAATNCESAMAATPIKPMPPVMTTDEVAALLRTSVATVERYVHEHKLDAIQIGRERRFRADDVLRFIDARPLTRRCK